MTRVATSIVRWLAAVLLVMTLSAVARAQTAQPLALGQVASGQFATQTDAAYYEIAATTADPLVVTLRGSASSGAYRLEVHQGALAGPAVGVLREYATDKSVEVQAPSPGSYFVAVLSTTTGSRTYELKAEQRAPIAVTLGTTLASQSLWSGGDSWYYRVTAATADPLLVMLQGTAFSSNYELEVHQGSLGGTTVGTLRETGNDQSVEVQSPTPGDYWIVVRGAADGARTFDLRVEQRSLVEAPSGTGLPGQPLWTVGDTWYYHVPVASSDPLLVMVQGSTLASSYAVELHQGSPAGTSVGVLRQYQNGQSLEVQAPVPGDYFAVVRAVAADAGSFNLRVVQRPPVAVTPATPLTAQLLFVPGDAWYYQFTANTNPLQVLVRGSTFSSGYALELHQGSLAGPAVGTPRDGTNEKAIELVAPSAGTYFAVVRSTTDGERTFDFDVEQRTTRAVADASTLSGQSLWGLGDARYYRVTAATADPLLLMVQGSTFASDLAVEVRQGSLTGPVVGVTTAYGNDTSVEVKTPALGDYYVMVRSATDGARTFSLRVDQRGTQVMEPSLPITGQTLSGVGDARYFVVPVTGGDGLVVWLSGSDLTTNYIVTVYQGSLGGPVVGVTRHEGYNLYVDVVAPELGDYYIVVQNGSAGSRSFSLQVDQAAASVVSITPKSGGNAGTLTTTIETRFLQEISAVRLVGADLSEVSGANTRAITDNGRFTTTFDLRTLAAGQYDVVITKTDNSEFRLPGGFTVDDGGGANLWVSVTAPTMRRNRESTVFVAYGNSGNVDSPHPWLALGFPTQLLCSMDVDTAWGPPSDTGNPADGNTDVTLLQLPPLTPGQTGVLRVRVTPIIAGTMAVAAELTGDGSKWFDAETSLAQETPPEVTAALQAAQSGNIATCTGACDANLSQRIADCMNACDIDANSPDDPSGTILFWKYTNKYPPVNSCCSSADTTSTNCRCGWHIAKSIGCGQYVDILQDGLKIRNIADAPKGDLFKLPSPLEKVVPGYRREVRARACAIREAFGQPGRWQYEPGPCVGDFKDNVLKTNRLGLFHVVNNRFSGENLDLPEDMRDRVDDALDSATKERWYKDLENPFRYKIRSHSGKCGRYMDALMAMVAARITVAAAIDPNAKYGPTGVGTKQVVSGDHASPYLITFENLETATAPAQEVVVTDQLDPDQVDLTTFSLGPIAFGNHVVVPPPGLKRHVTNVDLRPEQNLLVKVDAELDPVTAVVTWRLAALDPTTGQPPEDALAGFLPPNTSPPAGEGSVVFTVAPKAGLATGTEIRNRARIVFDANDPIDTAEWVNTLDSDHPASLVQPLDQMQASVTFQVCWAGADRGAGVMDYTVYVSEDGGPPTVWLENTTMTCGKYTGTPGKTYTFYSVARDLVGNIESMPTSPDVQTMVDPNAAGVAGAGGTAGIGGQSNPAGSPSAAGESAGGESAGGESAGGEDAGGQRTAQAGAGGASPATPAAGQGGAVQPSVGQAGSSAGTAVPHRVEPASGCACRTVPSRPGTIDFGLLLVAIGVGATRRRASRPKRDAKPYRQDGASSG